MNYGFLHFISLILIVVGMRYLITGGSSSNRIAGGVMVVIGFIIGYAKYSYQ
jgi:hypothetical protein